MVSGQPLTWASVQRRCRAFRPARYVPPVLRRWGSQVLGIIVALASVIFVATYWGFYPVGLILLMGIGLVVALVLRRQEKNEPPTPSSDLVGQRRHDARLVAELRELIPRQSIEW